MAKKIARNEIEEILSNLQDDSLVSLATTVTQGLSKNKINSKQEAIKMIIEYSPDELSILKRKVITRDILFSYCHKSNIILNPPITKQTLIDNIISYWNVTSSGEASTSGSGECAEHNISSLAEQFSEWFYSMLNSEERIGSEHFYLDAVLKINLYCDGQCTTNTVESNPEEIGNQLFLVKRNYDLFFNPNLTKEGVQGHGNPHGLVIVIVCGTLHTNNNCVGIFEQNFYLARDPFSENNWKIKRTELNLKSQNSVIGLPKLCNSEFNNSNIVSLPP